MKKTSKGFPILSFVILFALCACSKGFSGGTPTPPAEDKLEVKLNQFKETLSAGLGKYSEMEGAYVNVKYDTTWEENVKKIKSENKISRKLPPFCTRSENRKSSGVF